MAAPIFPLRKSFLQVFSLHEIRQHYSGTRYVAFTMLIGVIFDICNFWLVLQKAIWYTTRSRVMQSKFVRVKFLRMESCRRPKREILRCIDCVSLQQKIVHNKKIISYCVRKRKGAIWWYVKIVFESILIEFSQKRVTLIDLRKMIS